MSPHHTEGRRMARISRSVSSQTRPVIGALFLWLTFVSASGAQDEMPVTVVVARQSAVTERLPVVGSLAAREEVQVNPLVLGRAIEDILAETGEYVEKGQPLAVLDATEARMLLDKNAVAVLRARAAVEVEASRLDVAMVSEAERRKILDRSLALQPKGAVSQQLLEEHQNAYARAVAETALARQSLALAQADAGLIARERREIELTIERSTVRAPQAGMVLRRTARLGALTSGSADPLFVIARDARVEFVAQVPEVGFMRLRPGMRAEIDLPGGEGSVAGTLRLSAAELDPATRSGEVRIQLDETEGLRPGIFVRGDIDTSARRNIVLPGSAVKTAAGESSVFVVSDGIVGLRPVTVGARQDGLVEIVTGVSDGELVVLKAGGFIKAQDRVRPVPATSGAEASDKLAASRLGFETDGAMR